MQLGCLGPMLPRLTYQLAAGARLKLSFPQLWQLAGSVSGLLSASDVWCCCLVAK
jgi:hypothetical protein